LAFKALVRVAGLDLPEPSTYSGNTSTLVDSGRNVQGELIASVVREDVAKVEMTWNYLTAQQWAAINKKFSGKHGGSFVNDVTFYDQTSGDWITRRMYVSDRSAGMWRRDPTNGNILGWTNCKLSLIEV
jgi:hypothetical protein